MDVVVAIVSVPLLGAVQFHHTDFPPLCPACLGSLTSEVAPTLLPETVNVVPLSETALANASLAGPGTVTDARKATEPEAPPLPSTAILYTAPTLTGNETLLVVPPLALLSFDATALKAPMLVPW